MENNADTKIVNDDLLSNDSTQILDESATQTLNDKQDSIDDLLGSEPIVDESRTKSSLGKKLAVAAGIGVAGAATAGVGAYAIGGEHISDLLDDDDDERVETKSVDNVEDGANKADVDNIILGDADDNVSDEQTYEQLVDENATSEQTTETVVHEVNVDEDTHVADENVGEDGFITEMRREGEDGDDLYINDTNNDEDVAVDLVDDTDDVVVDLVDDTDPVTAPVQHQVVVDVAITPSVDDDLIVDNVDSGVTGEQHITLAQLDTDGMSFSEAFAAARAEVGAGGIFEWNGNYYGTYYEDEWKEFSDDFKQEFGNHNWASEYANENYDVAIGGSDVLDMDLNIDAELVADNSEHFEMSFVLDGEVSMPEIMEEVYDNLPGDIIAGDFDIDVEIAEVTPILDTDDVLDVTDDIFADNDVFDNDLLVDDDLLADVDGCDDLLC